MGFLNIVLSPIETIFDPIISIGKSVISIIALLVELIKLIPKIFSLFEMFTDPGKIIKDALYGVKTGIIMIFDAIFGELFRLITTPFVNTSNKHKNNNNNHNNKKTCFDKSFIKYILLVLCPPLAIFVKDGFKAIFNIIIASILTYFYYFPGLIYTSLYIL